MEHYSTQDFTSNLKMLNKIEDVFENLVRDKKARKVDVKHDYENNFIFGVALVSVSEEDGSLFGKYSCL